MSCVYLFRSLENVSQNSGGWLNVVGVFDKSCPKQRVSHADFSSGVYVVRLDPGPGRAVLPVARSSYPIEQNPLQLGNKIR